MKRREYKLVDKHGGYQYVIGTKYEVADHAIRNQLLMVTEDMPEQVLEEQIEKHKEEKNEKDNN